MYPVDLIEFGPRDAPAVHRVFGHSMIAANDRIAADVVDRCALLVRVACGVCSFIIADVLGRIPIPVPQPAPRQPNLESSWPNTRWFSAFQFRIPGHLHALSFGALEQNAAAMHACLRGLQPLQHSSYTSCRLLLQCERRRHARHIDLPMVVMSSGTHTCRGLLGTAVACRRCQACEVDGTYIYCA